MDVFTEQIEAAIKNCKTWKRLAEKAIDQTPEDKLHVALDMNTNSIAVIVQHCAGNLVSRWTDFLTRDGEKSNRNRDGEFIDHQMSREALANLWEKGWQCMFDELAKLTPADADRLATIRGTDRTIADALDETIIHMGYHIGQIVMIARIHAGEKWHTLTIERGGSGEFNKRVWGKG